MSAPAKRKPAKAPVKLPETVGAMPEFSPQEVKKEPNPFTDPDWRMLVYAWSGLGLRILLVVGAVFSGYQYLAAREEKRVERTFELVELWEKAEYQEAQGALARRLADLNQLYGKDLPAKPSEGDLAIYHDRVGEEAMRDVAGGQPLADFREEFGRIVYFLNRVGFCVEENLCSRHVADAYFLDYARSFWTYFAGYARGQRRTSPEFARAIESYVTAERPSR